MSSYTPTPTPTGTGFKARVQRFGGYLAGMVMPNIGAFIAWGLITALFIPAGWLPNETLAQLVDPIILYLLPVLIGYTGGRLVHGQRGAVVGAVATIGVVVGGLGVLEDDGNVPMFLGAMIIGPLAAYLMKLFDKLIENRIRPGFEMLVDNFSAGILGGGMALVGVVAIGPVIRGITSTASVAADWLVQNNLLPAVSVLVEPAKVLFLNNAINHGVFGPLGVAEAQEAGKSIMFMIETNPGPGFGLLLAFWLFGPRKMRSSVPAAAVIQFLGGIHEIYFPYVLMKPRLVLAPIVGGAGGLATAMIFNAGLVAPPAPGSIFAYIAVTPRGSFFGVFAAIVVATVLSFLTAALLLGFGRKAEPVDVAEPDEAGDTTEAVDTETKPAPAAEPSRKETTAVLQAQDIRKIVVACDAGMGSSVMLASQLRKQLKDQDVTVEHTPVDSIPSDADVIVCHEGLADRARATAPDTPIIPIQVFLGDPAVTTLIETIKKGGVLNV